MVWIRDQRGIHTDLQITDTAVNEFPMSKNEGGLLRLSDN